MNKYSIVFKDSIVFILQNYKDQSIIYSVSLIFHKRSRVSYSSFSQIRQRGQARKMGAVFVKIVTYYDIRMIGLILEALLSRMGKRRRSPDIERDREIQTREDKLGFREKRYSAFLLFAFKYEIGGNIFCSLLDSCFHFAVRKVFHELNDSVQICFFFYI